jgi:uncharacterized protein (TIGR03435 family)
MNHKGASMNRVWLASSTVFGAVALSVSLPASQANAPKSFSSVSIGRAGDLNGKPAGAVFYRPRASLRGLIEEAYGTTRARTTGGVDWMDDIAWQVTGLVDRGTPRYADVKEMLRNLLVDRFKLQAEFQTRPTSALVITLGDISGHPSIRKASARVDCQPFLSGDKAFLNGPKDQEGNPLCGPARIEHTFDRPIEHFRSAPLSSVARDLEIMLRRVVVWEPEVEGLFDVDFQTPAGYAGPGSLADPDAFMDALEAQFGATVAVRTVPVKLLVVQNAVKPILDSSR